MQLAVAGLATAFFLPIRLVEGDLRSMIVLDQ